ncbi:MAG: hypothetical protein VZQ98_10680 [Bacteroidales bacterium]|nr:hypothetical protein [Bacteroidales bacterium]
MSKKDETEIQLKKINYIFAPTKKRRCLIYLYKKMKKVVLFFAVSAAFALASCSNEQNQNATVADTTATVVEEVATVLDSTVNAADSTVSAAADSLVSAANTAAEVVEAIENTVEAAK